MNATAELSRVQLTRGKVLIVAPHPDDEVIGCGGLMAARVLQAPEVCVVHLTCASAVRRAEARDAHRELGGAHVVELGLCEGSVSAGPAEVARMFACLREQTPDVVFVPSFEDRHPDHRMAHRLLGRCLHMLREHGNVTPDQICCYEGFSPLVGPSDLFDFSASAEQKWAALSRFTTQDDLYRIVEVCRTLNRYRALTTFRRSVRFAEAFQRLDVDRYVSRLEVQPS